MIRSIHYVSLNNFLYFRSKIILLHAHFFSDNPCASPMPMGRAIPGPVGWTLPVGLFAAGPFSWLPAQLYKHFLFGGVGHTV